MNNKCDCENHYLELKSFDIQSNAFIHQCMCYECGAWWTYSDNTTPLNTQTTGMVFCGSYSSIYEIHSAKHGRVFYLYDIDRLAIKTADGFTYIT